MFSSSFNVSVAKILSVFAIKAKFLKKIRVFWQKILFVINVLPETQKKTLQDAQIYIYHFYASARVNDKKRLHKNILIFYFWFLQVLFNNFEVSWKTCFLWYNSFDFYFVKPILRRLLFKRRIYYDLQSCKTLRFNAEVQISCQGCLRILKRNAKL